MALLTSLAINSSDMTGWGEGRRDIGFYIRHGLGTKILASSAIPCCAQPEYLMFSISTSHFRPLLFVVIYRPPKLGHFALFRTDFERLHRTFPIAVIIGDFNIDLNRSSFEADSLLEFCASNHLFLVSFSDTHHTISSHTRIDHYFISDWHLLKSFHQRPLPFFSMHDMIEVTLDLLIYRLPPRLITVRDYSHFDLASFHNSLLSLDWSLLSHQLITLDAKVDLLTCFLLSTGEAHAPLRSFSAK